MTDMAGKKGQKKRFWSDEEKVSICAQTCAPGVSVAQVARRYPVGLMLIRSRCSVFPELDGNAVVTADAAGGLISVILNGAELPSTRDAPMRRQMPGFGDRLSDAEFAELATQWCKESVLGNCGSDTGQEHKNSQF